MATEQTRQKQTAGTSPTSRRKNQTPTRQVNVALPVIRMQMVDRLVAMDHTSLTQFFDRLVRQEIDRRLDALREHIHEERERARMAAESAERDLQAAVAPGVED